MPERLSDGQRLSSDYREKLSATIANPEKKNPVFETRRKVFQNRAGNFSEIGGKLNRFRGAVRVRAASLAVQGAPRDGRATRRAAAYDRTGRAQAAHSGRKWAGRYIYPLEGLNTLTGLVVAHRHMQPRGRHGAARIMPGAGAAVHPLEAADGGHRAVRLCEATRRAFALWAV